MSIAELSDEQRVLLKETTRVVEAGPGAGKTRALVQRFLQSASASSRGVALVSFTNAAIEEALARTAGSPDVLRAPHFVGTIDSFLHRFIVTPAEAQRLGCMPSYYASWDDLPSVRSDNSVRVRSVRGAGVPLSCFRIDKDGGIQLDRAGRDAAQYLNLVDTLGQRDSLLSLARNRIQGLVSRGIFDASAARVRAFDLLEGEDGHLIVSRISRRFSLLLVDEVQDCDEAEIEIIRTLAREGIATLVVADPDQAIYQFRGSKPQLFLDLRDSYPKKARGQLSVNFRSTHAICCAVTSLRCASACDINACRPDEVCAPVYVLAGSPVEQRAKFKTILEENGIEVADAMVLSHALKDAAGAAGRSASSGGSQALGNVLALACCLLRRDGESAKERLDAVKTVEKAVMRLIDWPPDVAQANFDAKLERYGLSRGWLRQAAASIVSGTAGSEGAEAFGLSARAVARRLLQSADLDDANVGSRIHKPTDDAWRECIAAADSRTPSLQCRTVHKAKGMEFEAVLVALPSRLRQTNGATVLDDWERGSNTEQRRVLYVAASRAKRVLVLGAGPHADRVAGLLANDGVPLLRA